MMNFYESIYWDFPHKEANFTDEDWYTISSGEKRLIRDWYLNDRDANATTLYRFDETTTQVRKAKKKFLLRLRPILSPPVLRPHWHLAYECAFKEEEWQKLFSGQKRFVRDWNLNKCDIDLTSLYRFDEGTTTVRKKVNHLSMRKRCCIPVL